MAGERLKAFSRDARFAASVMDPVLGRMEAEERPDPTIAAEAKVRKILAEHEPMPLEPVVSAELDRILSAYERDAPEE